MCVKKWISCSLTEFTNFMKRSCRLSPDRQSKNCRSAGKWAGYCAIDALSAREIGRG
jgi:hypothetical protein